MKRNLSIITAGLFVAGLFFFLGTWSSSRNQISRINTNSLGTTIKNERIYQTISGQREITDKQYDNQNTDSQDSYPEIPTTTQTSTPPPGTPLSFREVARKVLPVVVEVDVIEVIQRQLPSFRDPFEYFFGRPDQDQNREDEPREQEFRRPGLGSGVIVKREADTIYVLTNNHVVGDADEITVRLSDTREYEAEIVGKDARTDLALIRFSSSEEIPIAELGNSDNLYIGDWVLAIGNPYGFESTVTAGIVSALKREAHQTGLASFTDYIQTDASINPGNSGGALVNLQGQIIGINTWIASRDGGNVGLGFAIPINNARKVIDDFINSGKVEYGWLGVSIGAPEPEIREHLKKHYGLPKDIKGAFVSSLYTDSPAAKAGIRPGDFITAIDNTPVEDYNHLARIIGTKSPGSPIDVSLVRDGRELSLDLKLTLREADEDRGNQKLWPGFTVLPLLDSVKEQAQLDNSTNGVIVTFVAPGSPAAAARLQQGDLITEIENKRIENLGDFYRQIGEEKREYRMRVTRDDQAGTILLEK